MSELLDQLNEPQREAAECVDGPVMIIAGDDYCRCWQR